MSHVSPPTDRHRIYLDNAATSWPKPAGVVDAVVDYLRRLGAPAGRSAYREALQVAAIVHEARRRIARLIDAEGPQRIILTFNGSDSLNMVLHGLLQAGDHVVTTVCEHNSVLRPLNALAKRLGVQVTYVPCDASGRVPASDLLRAIRPETRLVAITHASNVTGALQPVTEVGAALRDRPPLLLVDAAQTAGHLPFSVREMGADFVAAPGHKGLLGPLGTGILYLRPGVEEQLAATRQGGTGTVSQQEVQPNQLPDKFETGSPNVAGIAGLAAAAMFLEQRGLDAVRRHAVDMSDHLIDGLQSIPGVRVYGPLAAEDRVAVVSIDAAGYDPSELAASLDVACHVQVRAGLHCAPRMHRYLGTFATGGTVRISPGPFTTIEQLDTAITQIARMIEQR